MIYDEEEYWSECCTAPPLYDLHFEEGIDTLGICMNCREHASFKQMEDE